MSNDGKEGKSYSSSEFENSRKNLGNHVGNMVKKGSISELEGAETQKEYQERIVETVKQEYFCLPNGIKSLLNSNLSKLFSEIIDDFIFLNNSYEGELMEASFIAFSYNDVSFNLKNKIFDFAEKYAKYHLSSATFNNAIVKEREFCRLVNPWQPYVVELVNGETNFFGIKTFAFYFFENLFKSIAWHVYKATAFDELSNAVPNRSLLGYAAFETLHISSPIIGLLTYCNESLNFYKELSFQRFILDNDIRFSVCNNNKRNNFDCMKSLAEMAKDLREIRPILVASYKARKSITPIFELSNDTYLLWQWETNGDCLGRICIGKNYENTLKQASFQSRADATYDHIFRVNYEGLLCGIHMEWMIPEKFEEQALLGMYDLNYFLLNKVYGLLLDWYLKVDLKKLTHRAVKSLPIDDVDEAEAAEAVVTATVQSHLGNIKCENREDSFTVLGESKSDSNVSIRHMKSSYFFRILTEKLGCIVTQGKGSEKNLFRNGGRIYRLGHHGREREIHSRQISDILKRLNISLLEWSTVLN